jgi:uncharacterized protein involved in outer membrane biogenesis
MNIPAFIKKHATKKLLLGSLSAFILLGVIGFFALPPLAKYVLTQQLSAKLHQQVAIQEVSINPYALSARITGFTLKEPTQDQPWVSFDELYLNLETSSLFRWGVVLDEIHLTRPKLKLTRYENLRYNFSAILEELLAGPPSDIKYSLNNIQITDGNIEFDDRPKHARHTVTDIRIALPFLSNLPYYADNYIQPAFHAKTDGTSVAITGKTKPFSPTRETTITLDVSQFDLAQYWEYVPVKLNFKLVSGKLDTQLSLAFTQPKEHAPTLILSGQAALKDLALESKGHPLLTLPEMKVAIASADIFAADIKLSKLALRSPKLYLSKEKSGRLNLASLMPSSNGNSKPSGKPTRIEIAEADLSGGSIQFIDESLPRPFRTSVHDLNLAVRKFSTASAKPASIEASLQTEDGSSLKHTGTLTLAPLAAAGSLEIGKLHPKSYFPYYGASLLFEVADGALDLSTHYQYRQEGDQFTLSGLSATLTTLRLKRAGESQDFLALPQTSMTEGEIDLSHHTVTIGQIASDQGTLSIKREANGAIDMTKLIVPSQARSEPSTPSTPWTFNLKKLALERYTVRFSDNAAASPVQLVAAPINLSVENMSSAKGSKATASLALTLNKTGSFTTRGTIVLNPLAVALKLDLKNADLVPLQPYFSDKINIVVSHGTLSSSGDLSMKTAADGSLQAAFKGDANLAQFASLNKGSAEDFLKWKSLYFGGIDVASSPLQLAIGEIALTDFYSRLIINPDGRFNLQDIVAHPQPPTPAAAPAPVPAQAQAPSSMPSVRIGKVALQGGDIDFTDHFIKPNYSANLTEIAGTVSGLSSDPGARANLQLRGNLEHLAPLEIDGSINPLAGNLYLDLKANVKGIQLSPFTPYSGKYAGYAIEKGKLSLNVSYHVENRKLEAQNNIFLDQLTFGEKVDSPTATKLPVQLAVALLKNRRGEIDVNLPISGSLDDPQFSVGGVIMKIILNLIVKAVTAPFALLGNLFGGGEELGYVEFAYGQSSLGPATKTRLDKLASALNDRPGLKLDIAGGVDPDKDREGLKQFMLLQKVKAQKLVDLVKQGQSVNSMDDITVEPAEYPRYLALAYKQENFPKPRNLVGLVKELPVPEMEKLMLTYIPIVEDDLRQLGLQRGLAVEDYLVQTSKVEAQRIFLVTAKSPKDGVSGSRADFTLK